MTLLEKLAEIVNDPFTKASLNCPYDYGLSVDILDSHSQCHEDFDERMCVNCWLQEYKESTDE